MLQQDRSPLEVLVVRRVFPAWSIGIPEFFTEAFVDESYWHAWDDERSVSMSSLLVTDGRRPVTAVEFLERLPPMDGKPVDELPPGLLGVAASCPATPPARASRLLSAILVVDGRALIVTITADDLDWAHRVLLTIRPHLAEAMPVH